MCETKNMKRLNEKYWFEPGDKAAIVCCSNGQLIENKEKLQKLQDTLTEIGLIPVFSDHIYAHGSDSVFSGSGKERAASLMNFYKDEEIKAIFDISGGDIANEVLSWLTPEDFNLIKNSGKLFWGYSDLTAILNAIYTKTGNSSVLYQVRNLISKDAQMQISRFTNTLLYNNILLQEEPDLFDIHYEFIQKEEMHGVVVGGNIRCFLKLAGTEFWPDMKGKILLLEAMGGTVPQMVTYLNQLKQMGVFQQVSGILLGTFTKMEKEGCVPVISELVKAYAGNEIPIAQTAEIGHGTDSKAIIIGKEMRFKRK